MLTVSTRRQLQRLRFLLEEALSRTQDQSDIGRHGALVILDGACEYAMGVALGHLGRPIRREFRQKFDDLRQALNGWAPDSWASVVQLHEARNQAQHHGIVADVGYLPGWGAQAQSFIDSLVKAAFDVELRTVLVAEAIETEDVRLPLVEAERAIQQEDASAAFAAAAAGFDAARGSWRGQRVEAIGQLQLQYTGLGHLAGTETDPTNVSLLRFEDLLEVQPFAPDIAEYHWLVARRGEVEQGLVPDINVARRVFLFVVAWVLRWEAFAAKYEARRYPPPVPPYVPPVTGSEQPVIYDAAVETLHHIGGWLDDPRLDNVRYSVKLTLADIPDEEPGLWAGQVGDALNEIISDQGSDHATASHVDAGGIVRLHGVTAQATGDEIRQWLTEALAEGDRRYRMKLAERRVLASRLPELRKSLDRALKAAGAGEIVAGVVSEERDDGSTWLGAPLEIDDTGDAMLVHVLQRAALSILDCRSDVQWLQSSLWFQLDHDHADAAVLVAKVDAEYRAQAEIRRRGLADVEDHRNALETDLRAGTTSEGLAEQSECPSEVAIPSGVQELESASPTSTTN
jgi:hypothetical protein